MSESTDDLGQAMPANQRPVRPGGLMRCCLGTLADSVEETTPGSIMSCKAEPPDNQNMIVAVDGIWEWNR